MNRRTFVRDSVVALAASAFPKSILAQDDATPEATPQATPEAAFERSKDAPPQLSTVETTNDWIAFSREFEDSDGIDALNCTLYAFPNAIEAQSYIELLNDYYLEPDDNYYLPKERKEVPSYGDRGFTISGKLGPDWNQLTVCFSIGSVAYTFRFFSLALARAQEFADEVIPKVLERHFERDTYTDDELYELLPTEGDTGLTISNEEFLSEANER
jgi:hypothetical protein